MLLRTACVLFLGWTATAQERSSLDLGDGVLLELVKVPASTFHQAAPDEKARDVTISHAFWVGRTEVTRRHFARFVAETGHRTEAERGTSGGFGWNGKELEQRKHFTWRDPGFPQTDTHPVCLVSWEDANAFCKWLAQRSGNLVSLPTEAEWELACRAGTKTVHHGGDDDEQLAKIAWFKRNSGFATHPVAEKDANALGLHDLAGNVYEWCLDWYAPYSEGPLTDPVATIPSGDKARRVLRGGSWHHDGKRSASSARWRSDPASRSAENGFRVAVRAEVLVKPVLSPASRASPGSRPTRGGPYLGASLFAAAEFPMGWVLVVLAVGLLLPLFVILTRESRGSKPPSTGVRIEKTRDGFHIHVDRRRAPLEVTVRWRCRDAEWQQERFLVDAVHFVYAGAAPLEVQVVRAAPPRSHSHEQDLLPELGHMPRPVDPVVGSTTSWSAY